MLLADQAASQGLVLLRSHGATASVFGTLSINSYRVGQIQNHIPDFQFDDSVVENALYTHQLNTARQVLEQGGTINISADGAQGYSKGLTIGFHNRCRPFWSSFAELAVMTGAQVRIVTTILPQEKALYQIGQTRIQLSKLLDNGNESQPHAARVEQLVEQYVAALSRHWQDAPWLAPWYQMERHLAYCR